MKFCKSSLILSLFTIILVGNSYQALAGLLEKGINFYRAGRYRQATRSLNAATQSLSGKTRGVAWLYLASIHSVGDKKTKMREAIANAIKAYTIVQATKFKFPKPVVIELNKQKRFLFNKAQGAWSKGLKKFDAFTYASALDLFKLARYRARNDEGLAQIYLMIGCTNIVLMKKSKARQAFMRAIMLKPNIKMQGKRFWKSMKKALAKIRNVVTGRLLVQTKAAGAVVLLNGKKIGLAGKEIIVLSGDYKVHIADPTLSNTSAARSVFIEPGKLNKITLILKPRKAILTVTSIPSAADVFLNDRYFGRTPIYSRKLESAVVAITVKKKNHHTVSGKLTLQPGRRKHFNVRLTQISKKVIVAKVLKKKIIKPIKKTLKTVIKKTHKFVLKKRGSHPIPLVIYRYSKSRTSKLIQGWTTLTAGISGAAVAISLFINSERQLAEYRRSISPSDQTTHYNNARNHRIWGFITSGVAVAALTWSVYSFITAYKKVAVRRTLPVKAKTRFTFAPTLGSPGLQVGYLVNF